MQLCHSGNIYAAALPPWWPNRSIQTQIRYAAAPPPWWPCWSTQSQIRYAATPPPWWPNSQFRPDSLGSCTATMVAKQSIQTRFVRQLHRHHGGQAGQFRPDSLGSCTATIVAKSDPQLLCSCIATMVAKRSIQVRIRYAAALPPWWPTPGLTL